MLDINKIKNDFPILKREIHGKPLVYLDNAATTLKPVSVVERIRQYYLMETSNIHRGVYYLSEQGTLAFEAVRKKIKDFIGAGDTSEIIFTKSATESINLVAHSFGRTYIKEGDEILITEMEHHSNIVPWQMLCQEIGCLIKVIPIDDEGSIRFDQYEEMLNPKVKLVSLLHVSNALGSINPVKKIIDSAHRLNIPVLIDGTQAVSNTHVNVRELDCDFYVFSGHKIFGPTGIGVLYGKASWLEAMPPFLGGGDMILSVTFEKTIYNHIPYKFEAGTPPIAEVIGLGSAIDYILSIGLPLITSHAEELALYGTQALQTVPGIRLIGTAANKRPIFSFVFEEIHPHDIGTLLDRQGIAVRTGHHCTQPVMHRYQVPATTRASFSIYNSKEDMDKLIQVLMSVKDRFK
ncbi:MAG: cysteine desulfurase [Candidatus Aureabacteria bacterium]|nr:cysteine desulfurase [Candidatus Auribacterota bacterium]